MLQLDLLDEVGPQSRPAEEELAGWAEAAWLGAGDAVVSLRIVNSKEIEALNSRYRGKNKATNVLSFPMDLPSELGIPLLGDLVICAEVVAQEAVQQHKTPSEHWAHMVVHGMLHLQGYDHVDDEQAIEMERLEKRIMKAFGYADPYQDEDKRK